MNIINSLRPYLFWFIGAIILITICLVIFLLIFFRKKEEKIPLIDISEILDAFGSKNIIGVEQVQKRIRIEVKDVEAANLELLKELTNGIFVTGDKFVLTFKHNTEEIVKALKNAIK